MSKKFFEKWVEGMSKEQEHDREDVAAIIVAMTDGERRFVCTTVAAVLADAGIGQAILCVEERNSWVDVELGRLIADPRLEIIRIPMGPPAVARNRALSLVRLPWVAYCDGDDVWCSGKTQIQRRYANEYGCEFVGGDHYLTDEEGKIRAFALARYISMPSSWMASTEVMTQHPFDESLRPGEEDGEWWVRTRDVVPKVRCPQMLIKYRVRSGSVSSSTPSKQRKARLVAFASHPMLEPIILFFTWLTWFITRQENYVWLKEWNS